MTDVGMTGPHDSIIGMEPENVLKSFLYGRHFVFYASSKRPSLQGVVMEFDDENFTAKSIKSLNYPEIFQRGETREEESEKTPAGEGECQGEGQGECQGEGQGECQGEGQGESQGQGEGEGESESRGEGEDR
jgi:hypothetical protein